MGQLSLADIGWQAKGKTTKRERFLAEMDAVIPWARFVALITPHYPKAGNGTQPYPLERMLRLYFVQQWYDLSDPAAEEAVYDSESIRRFVGVELGRDRVPDETTILRFRRLLETHALTEALFVDSTAQLRAQGLLVHTGTIVDATLIAAPSSTKNKTQTRDPEMRQTRKGQQWYFGMKAHIGTDARGIVHTVTVTDAAVADITELPNLLHGEEEALHGDSAYHKKADRARWEGEQKGYFVNRRGAKTKPLTEEERLVNREQSRVRASVEHPFLVVKHLWGFRKVRYRGLAKNLVRVYALFGLANLYRLRHDLLRLKGDVCPA